MIYSSHNGDPRRLHETPCIESPNIPGSTASPSFVYSNKLNVVKSQPIIIRIIQKHPNFL